VPDRGEVNKAPYTETGILLALMNGEDLRAQGLMDEMTREDLKALETWAIKMEEMAYATRIKLGRR
jgi:hypothetical protein